MVVLWLGLCLAGRLLVQDDTGRGSERPGGTRVTTTPGCNSGGGRVGVVGVGVDRFDFSQSLLSFCSTRRLSRTPRPPAGAVVMLFREMVLLLGVGLVR